MIDAHMRFVARTLKKAGVPPSELDDEVQRTFIVAASRIADVHLGAERTFLYQVALNVAAHTRRRMARRREVLDNKVPERIEALATPEQLTSRREMRQLIDQVARHMGDALYQVFRLHEFEGANLKEIARRIGVPRGTVASRLRRARAQFRKHAGAIDLAWDFDGKNAKDLEEPTTLQSETMSRLMQAMLRAGAFRRASASMRRGTLATLGIPELTEASSDATVVRLRAG
jgi:RNA polymerase sigma-70 factor (ECF subfamily)